MDDLTRRMAELGAPDPSAWASSEVRENIAQQARYLFLRVIWPDLIDPYHDEGIMRRIPAAARLLEAGASAEDPIACYCRPGFKDPREKEIERRMRDYLAGRTTKF